LPFPLPPPPLLLAAPNSHLHSHPLPPPSQIRQCERVAEAGERHAADDAARIRRQLRALHDELAAAEVLRRRHARRRASLRALAAAEEENRLAFARECARAAGVAGDRLRVAQAGAAAVAELREGLQALQALVGGELARFRAAGAELLLDVAADCAATQAVAHSASFALEHYEREALAGKEAAQRRGQQAYTLCRIQSDTAEMERLEAESRARRQEIRRAEERADELRAEQDRLARAVEAPWALLRRSALGGPAAADAAAVRVRTSAANLRAWGADERSVERAEGWNRAMREEAAALKTLLLTGGP
jgi:hypothetical protein